MNMRIGGLASGMDIDQIVSDLMKAQSKRVDIIKQDQELIQWRQENYQEVNKSLANFILDTKKELGLITSSSSGTILNSSVSRLEWVKSANISDSDIAEVKAYANAAQGSYDINVSQLAENWSSASSGAISLGTNDNLVNQFGLVDGDTIDFTITTNKGSVTVNKTNLSNVSLSDIVSEINQANIGVSAIYDKELDRFFLQTKSTGTENTIQISDNSPLGGGKKLLTGNKSLLKLQYIDDANVAQDLGDGIQYNGKDSFLNFGAATNIIQSSNTFTINNVNITLKEVGQATLNVSSNVSGVLDKIKSFVEKYNEMISSLGSELGEKIYKEYRPLTDEQREAMSDKDVEMWEERAKSGLLRNDSTLERVLQRARSGMYEKVEGVTGIYDHLTEIGITTEAYSSNSRGGKLVIDNTKLASAIETDVDSVLELLFKEPSEALITKSEDKMTSAELTQKRSESGLISRLYDNMVGGMKEIIYKAGTGNDAELYRGVSSTILVNFIVDYSGISMLEKEDSRLDKRIDTLNDYLSRAEDRYWRQFSAMESALQRMNQQSAWLTQQFSQN